MELSSHLLLTLPYIIETLVPWVVEVQPLFKMAIVLNSLLKCLPTQQVIYGFIFSVFSLVMEILWCEFRTSESLISCFKLSQPHFSCSLKSD